MRLMPIRDTQMLLKATVNLSHTFGRVIFESHAFFNLSNHSGANSAVVFSCSKYFQKFQGS